MNQSSLLEQIKKELACEGVKFKQDQVGNIWSIFHPGKPCFVAHCDTVMSNDLGYHSPLIIKDGIVTRSGNYILGADDRAGVNIILNHKHDINFVFTVDEEIGCVGANILAKNTDFVKDCDDITFFCELDRKGHNDCLGNVHGYCNDELAEKVCDALGYKDTYGIFTDIDEFAEICQGVNLSVGYYNPHSIDEYLVLDEWEYINSMIPVINEIKVDKIIYAQADYYKYMDGYYGYDDKEEVCPICGRYKSSRLFVNGICPDCYYSTIVETEHKHICSVCSSEIDHGELHCYVEDYDLYICGNCYEEVISINKKNIKDELEGDDL